MKDINLITLRKALVCFFSVFSIVCSEAQNLQELIEVGQENNPEIKSFQLKYAIAEEKVNETDYIPNTEFGLGYFVSEPETRTGAQRARFSAKQMLPWFGSMAARSNYASSIADTEFLEISIAKRQLALSVSQAYYRLFELQAKQAVLQQNVQLLKTYEQLALTSVEVGKASAVDILKLQIRQNELEGRIEVLQSQYIAEQASLNRLLNRDMNSSISVYGALEIPSEDPIIQEEVLMLNPELLKYDKMYASVITAEALNQSQSNPMIGFGLDYIPVSERPNMNFSDNGKDIIMPMLSISIPIFNNQFRSVTKQNDLRQQQLNSQKNNRLNVLQTKLVQAIAQRNQARIQFETQEKNLKQAKNAEEILLKNYETGTIDFNEILDIQELQLKIGLDQIEAIQNYYLQSASINYLINN